MRRIFCSRRYKWSRNITLYDAFLHFKRLKFNMGWMGLLIISYVSEMAFEANNKEKMEILFSRRTQLFVFEKKWKKVMTQAKIRACHRRTQYVTLVAFACSNNYWKFYLQYKAATPESSYMQCHCLVQQQNLYLKILIKRILKKLKTTFYSRLVNISPNYMNTKWCIFYNCISGMWSQCLHSQIFIFIYIYIFEIDNIAIYMSKIT